MAKEVVASVSFVDLIFRGVTQAGKEKSQHFTRRDYEKGSAGIDDRWWLSMQSMGTSAM